MGDVTGFCKLEVNPLDPIHDHDVAFREFAVSVTEPPTHIGPLFIGAAVGVTLTVSVVVYTVEGLQPVPGLLTVNEYVVVIVGDTTGFCRELVEPSDPIHDHAVALLEFALSVAVPPVHIGLLVTVAPVDDGTGFTVTTCVLVQPDPAVV